MQHDELIHDWNVPDKKTARIQFDDEWLYREVAKPVARRKIPMRQLLHDEALPVFAEWQAKSDKVQY